MKKVAITLICVSWATCTVAQNEELEKTIRQMDQKNAALVIKADTVALMDLLSPLFTIHRTTGGIVSGRDKTYELMRQGLVAYERFDVQTDFVLIQSSTLAISMGSEVIVSGGNRDLKGQTVRRSFTHVWAKEDGTWRLLVRHANRHCTQ